MNAAMREKGFLITMKNTTAIAALALTLIAYPTMVHAQEETPKGESEKSAAKADAKQTAVTLDVRDARLRDVLEMLFQQAKVNFLIDAAVNGFVTMKVSDLPFEAALKLTLRSGSVPLAYVVENGVYIVKPRPVDTVRASIAPPPIVPETTIASNSPKFEVMQLIHADPADFAQLLNIIILPTGTRFGNPTPGGSGGLIIGSGFPGLGAGTGTPGAGTGVQNNPGNPNSGGRSGSFTPPGMVIVAP